jgi:predicted GIY-YIG superfamily endonuclease
MWHVNIIRSMNFREQEYIGATADLKRRIPEHNAGSVHAHCQIQTMGIGLVLCLPR